MLQLWMGRKQDLVRMNVFAVIVPLYWMKMGYFQKRTQAFKIKYGYDEK
jgi:hypothetical protein